MGAALVLAALVVSVVVLLASLLSLLVALTEMWLGRLGEPDYVLHWLETVG